MALRKHISLSANTAASVTLSAKADSERLAPNYLGGREHKIDRRITSVLLVNLSETDTVFYRFDGVAPTATGADDDWVLPPRSAYTHAAFSNDELTFVVISSGTPSVSIQAAS